MSQTLAEKTTLDTLKTLTEPLETPLLHRKLDKKARPNTKIRERGHQSFTQKMVNSIANNVSGDFAGNFSANPDDAMDGSVMPPPRSRRANTSLSGGFANEFAGNGQPRLDVRISLAGRIAALLPNISGDRVSQLYAFAVQALGTIALDEVLKIRVALASAIKDYAHTPPKIAAALARDVEREVSEPILRFCASLPDEDLLDILRGHPEDWVVEAIANRKKVSGLISMAVIETDSRSGGLALLENQSSELSEPLLQQIVAQSRDFTEWQRPLANRAALPISIAKKLAEFVDSTVWEILFAKDEYDREEINEIVRICRRRINFASEKETSTDSLEIRLHNMFKQGRLNANIVSDALAMGDKQFVRGAMAYLSKTTMQTVDRIFRLGSAKPIIALTWKARLPMRLALLLQQEMGQVPHRQVIYPKGGTDYPLSDDELQWQVEFLGV